MNFKRTIRILPALLLLPLAEVNAANLVTGRHGNTLTLLPDGNFLVTGGVTGTGNTLVAGAASVEIFATSAAAWGVAAPMLTVRSSHTATLMADGRVLVAGGFINGTPTDLAEIYDSTTAPYGSWSPVGTMSFPRGAHTATLLNKGANRGKVLLCGGQSLANPTLPGGITATCDLFPGATATTFSAAPFSMNSARMGHTASGITNGKVFVSGGMQWNAGAWVYLPTNELYDSGTGVWTPVSPLNDGRVDHTSTVLNNGNIVISGGYNAVNQLDLETELPDSEPPVPTNQNAGSQGFLGSVEMFNPEGGREMVMGKEYGVMPYRLARHSSILSPDGKQVTMGGYGNILPTLFTGAAVFTDTSYSSMSATGVLTANLLPSSVMTIEVKKMLSRAVNGRIVDGDLFLMPVLDPAGEPTFEAENVKVYMVATTTVTLDGSPVGHEIPRIPEQPPGQFWDDVSIKLPSGTAVFEARDAQADIPAQNYVITSSITWTGGPITSLSLPKTLDSTTSSITFNASFKVPAIYIGGKLTGTAAIRNAGVAVEAQYRLIFDGGTASFANVPVVADGLYGRITFQMYIGPASVTPLSGTVTNIYPDTTTLLGTGIDAGGRSIADGMNMSLSYTSDRIDLSGLTYAHDPSNIIIREMIFSDQLSFNPSSTRWDFNPISMGMPLFSFTSMVTPAADMLFAGGRNCGIIAPGVYLDCIRTRTGPPASAPTFTALSYSNAYVSRFEAIWPEAPAMLSKRAFHTSTVLPDSSILTCGGSYGATTLRSCELLPPNSGVWIEVSSMTVPRALHTATLLPNGSVLVVGGTAGSSTSALKTAELFSPNSGRWTPVQSMTVERQNHTANLLPNGDVLIAGGGGTGSYLNSAEIYKTTAATWQPVVALMNARRSNHVAVNMKSGNILMIGGINGSGATTSVDRFDYSASPPTWTPMNPLGTPRYNHAANLLRDGRIMVSGGSPNTGSLKTVEIFDGTNWTPGWPMKYPRANHRSLLLPNGKIMVTGGEMGGVVYNIAEGYDPDLDWWNEQGQMVPRAHHTTVLTQDNHITNIGGGSGGLDHLNTCETIYFSYEPDMSGLSPYNRNPLITTGTATLDRNESLTILSSSANFHGITEASGGGAGPGNASFSNPRVYLQAVDIPTGFMVDVTTRLYTLYGGVNDNWQTTLSSITVRIPLNPGELPYGYYHARVAANGQFSPGHIVQVTVPRPSGSILFASPAGTVLSSNTIRWDWTQNTLCNPTGICDGYIIFSSSNNVIISTVAFVATSSYTQTGLTPNTEISVKIGGYNTGGYSSPLVESGTYYTNAVEPVLSLVSASFSTAILTWNPLGNSPFTIYEVSMSKSATFLPVEEIITPIPFNDNYTSTSATISSLLPNQNYSFRVRAKSGRLGSGTVTAGYSNIVTTITVSNVTNLSGAPLTMSTISWSWDPAIGDPPYEIYDVTNGTGVAAVFLASTTVSSFLQGSLSTNTYHRVGVNAYSGTNKGPISYSNEVYTLAVPPLRGVPQVFTNITTGSFTLNWIANGNPAGTTYYVAVDLDSDLTDADITYQLTKTSTTIISLTPNTLYYTGVVARNGDGVPTTAADLGSEYTRAQAPVAGSFMATSISMSGIGLGWDQGQNPADTIYEVRGSTTQTDLSTTTPKNLITYVPFSAYHTGASASIGGLLTATTYYFDIAAYTRTSLYLGPTARIQANTGVYTLPGPGGAPSGSIGGTSNPGRDSTITGILPNGRAVSLYIPAAAFPSETAIAISSSVVDTCVTSCARGPIPLVEVAIWTDNDAQPLTPVTLTLNYTAAEAATITPNIAKLVMTRLNPVSGEYLPLDTKINPGPRTITARLNHFSVFQLRVRNVPTDLGSVRIYPNPYYTNRGQGFVTINNVPAGTEAVIYTLSGDKVWEGTAGSSGMMTWDGVNNSGVLVASGIYLAALDSTGGKKVFKIAVIR